MHVNATIIRLEKGAKPTPMTLFRPDFAVTSPFI